MFCGECGKEKKEVFFPSCGWSLSDVFEKAKEENSGTESGIMRIN
jgi:hypothetical protein